jgi:hypothetical protein
MNFRETRLAEVRWMKFALLKFCELRLDGFSKVRQIQLLVSSSIHRQLHNIRSIAAKGWREP